MRKIIASLLAVVMVVCAFSTMSVSAAEGNLFAGATYTATYNAFLGSNTDNDSVLLNDGAFRGDGTNAWNGDSGVAGVTVEYAGTAAITTIEFALAEATDIGSIVFKGARDATALSSGNRHFMVVKIEYSADGETYVDAAADTTREVIADAPKMADADGNEYDQFFDYTSAVSITGATKVRIILTTTKYVLQLDEIEAYAPTAGGDAPVEDSEAPVVSDDAPVEDSDVVVDSEDASVEDSDVVVDSDDASVEDSDVVVDSDDASADDASDDASADDASADDSSDEVVEVPVADITFTVTYTDNGDGTGTIAVTLPAGIGNGKIALKTSEDLVYVDGSVESPIGGTVNALNVAENGIIVSFASPVAYEEGAVVFTANYDIAEGATIDASDIIVDVWNLGDGSVPLSNQNDGDVNKVIDVDEPVVDSISSEDAPVEESSVDAPVVEESSEAAPVEPDNDIPTGDLGIAAFAVLAVISAGAVVVLKKKA